jgi:hypothetical protein
MGRPKTPMSVREVQGTAHRNKQRNNNDAPEVTMGIGESPEYFSDIESDIWDYLVSIMPARVMSQTDRPTFEVLVKLFHRFRHATYEEDSILPPLNGAELNKMVAIMGTFGMNPSDRQKIVVPKQQSDNPFKSV